MMKPISYTNRRVIKENKPIKSKLRIINKLKLDNDIGVYAIVCEETKSVYIGQSRCISSRLRQHKHALNKGEYLKRYKEWQNDFDLLGVVNFKFGRIFECEEDKLLYYETYYISQYVKDGYHIYNHIQQPNNNTIINCPNEYAILIRKLVKHLEKGTIKAAHIEASLHNADFY